METELNKLLEYIELNIQSDLKLNEITDVFHYSFSHLSRNFNKYVGTSFNDYVNRRRLSLIAIEIRKKQKSISYLADIYGYSSQKYFSTKFKDVFSITPTTYKKGKTFIVLQPIRKIKGEEKYMINNMKELCFHIWEHSTDENSLLDTVAKFKNVLIYKKENSKITLISYFDEGEYTNIYEIDLNLINGLYDVRNIFCVENKLHTLKELDYDENGYFIIFEDKKSKKHLRADFEQGHQPYVIFQTNTVDGFKFMPQESEDNFDMKIVQIELDNLKKAILSKTNELEIKDLCDKDADLVLMRYFGSEFVLVKLTKQNNIFMLNSIYANMSKKDAMSYHFFKTLVNSEDIKIEKEGNLLNTYVDNKLFSTSYILGGSENVSSIFLKFPSGMSGSGGWDFSAEFDE